VAEQPVYFALHARLTPHEIRELGAYQYIEYPSMSALASKLVRWYLMQRRRHYSKLGMLEQIMNKIK